jgi:hypothetical protein
MIFNYFASFALGVLLSDFFDRRFPDEYKLFTDFLTNLFINASYNCVYYYSKCEIFFNKYIKTHPIYLAGLKGLSSEERFYRTYVKGDSDFVITSDKSIKPFAKRITYGEEKCTDLVFETSDIKFMLIEFKIDDSSYKIDLKTDNYNYYMVDNKFTKDFFIFFLSEHMKIDYKPDCSYKCSLNFIDHNVNSIALDFTDKNECIILEKNNYKVINN